MRAEYLSRVNPCLPHNPITLSGVYGAVNKKIIKVPVPWQPLREGLHILIDANCEGLAQLQEIGKPAGSLKNDDLGIATNYLNQRLEAG